MKKAFVLIVAFLANIICLSQPNYLFSSKKNLYEVVKSIENNQNQIFSGNVEKINDIRYKLKRHVLTLEINPNIAILEANKFEIKFYFKVLYGDSISIKEENRILKVNYDITNKYESRSSFVLEDFNVVNYIIDSIQFSDERNNLIPILISGNLNPIFNRNTIKDIVFLKYQQQLEKYYKPVKSLVIVGQKIKASNGYLKMEWPSVYWATGYDLEYSFIDSYDDDTSQIILPSAIAYNFKFNCTRINLIDTVYEIPKIFEKGYFLFRIRPAGYWGEKLDKIVYGQWSLKDQSDRLPLNTSQTQYYYFINQSEIFEGDSKEWQYLAKYSENGKRKDKISFIDGTQRERQTITSKYTDLSLIVNQTVYDFYGRPSISILPTPIVPDTLDYGHMSAFNYKNLFNLSKVNISLPYSWRDFDKNNSCLPRYNEISQDKGAGNYYSHANQFADLSMTGIRRQSALIPDAKGYPFLQKEYMPDNSNRVKSIGGPGVTHSLVNNSNHYQKFYYGTPSQQELDVIFGNDIGYAKHYSKEIVIDENNLAHVTYKDIKNNTIATALTGSIPSSLDSIEHVKKYNDTISVDLIESFNSIDKVSGTINSAFTMVLTSPSFFKVDYGLLNKGFSYYDPCSKSDNICFDCIYDLEIKIVDECGTIVWIVKENIGSLAELRKCDNPPIKILKPFQTQLQIGTYYISKILRVNQTALDNIVDSFLLDPCWNNIQVPKLSPCEEKICSLKYLQKEGCTMDDRTGVIIVGYNYLPVYDSSQNNCLNIANNDFISLSLQKMLADLYPGGQYANYYNSTPKDISRSISSYPLSVLNTNNQLPTKGNWRMPVTPYRNEDGTIMKIDFGNGSASIKPEELSDYLEFIKYWTPSMAYSLLPYHPEYCIYEWYMKNEKLFDYDNKLSKTIKFSVAQNEYPDLVKNPYNLPDSNDPLFNNRPNLKSQMKKYMENIKLLDSSQKDLRPTPMYVAASISAAGFSFPVDTNFLVNYLQNHKFYTDKVLQDNEWQNYKTLYQQARKHILDSILLDELQKIRCCETILDIGRINCENSNKNCLLFKDKIPVFINLKGAYSLIDTTNISKELPKNTPLTCGKCNRANNLPEFLNQMLKVGSLYKSTRVYSNFLAAIGNRITDSIIANAGKIIWIPDTSKIAGPYKLNGKIVGISKVNDTIYKCILSLTLNQSLLNFNWKSLIGFTCLSIFNDSTFTIKGFDELGNSFDFSGITDCVEMQECTTTVKPEFDNQLEEYTNIFVQMIEALLKSKTGNIIPKQVLSGRSIPNPLYVFGEDPVYQWHLLEDITVLTSNFSIPLQLSIGQLPKHANIFIDHTNTTCINDFKEWKIIGYELVPSILKNGKICSESSSIKLMVENRNPPYKTEIITVTYGNFPLGKSCIVNKEDSLCCFPLIKIPLINEPDCDSLKRLDYRLIELNKIAQLKKVLADSLRKSYMAHCLNAAETFMVKYIQSTYHYTLRYYDRVGNLIKTIPPKGVAFVSRKDLKQVSNYRNTKNGIIIIPKHTMYSTYEYNSANKLITMFSPDAGISRFSYDEQGRIIYDQNAEHYGGEYNTKQASFYSYDSLNRIDQTGRITLPSGYSKLPALIRYKEFKSQLAVNNLNKTDVITNFYDKIPDKKDIVGEFDFDIKNLNLRNLRNRLSASVYHQSFQLNKPYTHAYFYNYDIGGNIDTLLQDFREIENYDLRLNLCGATKEQRLKKIVYNFDLFNKKTKMVWYQPNKSDQLIHWYSYDAEERLVSVKTSNRIWEDTSTIDSDARYNYYLHGPLARKELGSEKIQGLDYVYTIQGWLKGVNSILLNSNFDIGKDDGHRTLKDAFAYSLNYYKEDYTPIHNFQFTPTINTPVFNSKYDSRQLFNGNIQFMITSLDKFQNADKVFTSVYKYDALNRIKQMEVFQPTNPNTTSWSMGNFSENFKSKYNYDLNGNISLLSRVNRVELMDDLKYIYNSTNNQLIEVNDVVGKKNAFDLDKVNRFQYDLSGKLIQEKFGSNLIQTQNYLWNNFDKIQSISADNKKIEFLYSGSKHRVFKYDNELKKATYYVNDLNGNPMAIYNLENGKMELKELPIYGTTREGIWYTDLNLLSKFSLNQFSFKRGSKEYELSNHLGNVLTTVSDRKVPVAGNWTVDIKSASDYYPFGMIMPGRSFEFGKYRYGFNGKEKVDEINDDGNTYDLGARMYSSRLGKMFSPDPRESEYPWQSTYAYYSNSPIVQLDYYGEGDYYGKNGKHLGSDNKKDNFVYSASGTKPTEILDGNGKGTGKFNTEFLNANKLSVTHTQFQNQAATVYAESSVGYGIESEEEMFAIASVHQRNKVAYGADAPAAQSFLNTSIRKQTSAMQLSNAAMINALNGGFDYSYGADQWDGAEQAMVSKANMDKASNGRFMYKMNVMGWSISDANYKSWKSAVEYKFGTGKFTVPQNKAAMHNYGGMTNKEKTRLNSTAQYGLTIFWKTNN